MNCRRAQAQIALWLEEGLDRNSEDELESHLAACTNCREHLDRLQASLACLHASDQQAAGQRFVSLWPGLSNRLPNRAAPLRSAALLRWTAVVAVSLAWAAILISMDWRSQTSESRTFSTAHLPAAANVPARGLQQPASAQIHPLWPDRPFRTPPQDWPSAGHDLGAAGVSLPFVLHVEYRCPHCGQVITGNFGVLPSK